MRVFVYEHMNSGAVPVGSAAASLHAEGWAMLSAVLRDLRRCPGVDTVTLLGPRQSTPGEVIHAAGAAEEESAFRRLAREADRTLVIAPETGGILEARCRWVVEEGGRLLGPSPAAVRLTADKLALASHLADRGVPTPPTRLTAGADACPFPFPVVVKPRDGAGSLATYYVGAREEWPRRCVGAAAAAGAVQRIVQPFVRGKAASVALLIGPGGTLTLPPAEQHLSTDGRLRYEGGRAPLASGEARRARVLAETAVAAVPGLRGFVGVDLVLGDRDDGRSDAVIEINPRLTTSYIGLRELARFNLAATILAVTEGAEPPACEWSSGRVCWRADGTVNCGQFVRQD
jgi:predicted ATP-grasp superfamily ATP-dependent carboligase